MVKILLWCLGLACVVKCEIFQATENFEGILDDFESKQASCDLAPVNIDAATQAVFVQLHNQYRANERSAVGMMKMRWNDLLAQRAQAWANYLAKIGKLAHGYTDLCNDTQLGQNAWSGSRGYDITTSVTMWQSEISNYTYSTGQCWGVCGHYTQVVWASSYLVGCGYAASATKQYVICNYYPPGNYYGEKPYPTGKRNITACQTTMPVAPAAGLGMLIDSNGLCDFCQGGSSNCSCYECKNGGVLNSKTCGCACPDNFTDPVCGTVCRDIARASSCSSWAELCSDPLYADFLQGNCPCTCKKQGFESFICCA